MAPPTLKPRVRTGQPFPLGASWDGNGVNFVLHSAVATRVELCLFDGTGGSESRRVEMVHRRGDVWYGYVPEIGPGQLYGWRVHGPCDPAAGIRCNPHKVLLDPYARAIVGAPAWTSAHYGYVPGEDGEDLSCSTEDDAALMPRCQVVDDRFDWGDSAPPRTPWHRSVIYELHVKGFTQLHPGVPEAQRGSYAGLASPAVIAHLRALGVTAVELLPVHAFVDDHRLVGMGLGNYWGYNSIGFFAPDARYSSDRSPMAPLREFKQMVRTLHEAGIEVILDVVYNHTAEGNHLGPTLGFKGIDHAAYYRLSPEDPRYCVDFTGTGNSLDTTSPVVVRLIMDSLRYWAAEMQIDGFRFDLATSLGRGAVEFETHHPLFTAIAQDPLLSQVKLIAEPWDLGPGGYRVGGFPHGWAEWNGPYRDTVRSFWCQRQGHITQLAQRICGSADLFEHRRRAPTDSINIVTVHDGFTLQDLVSYNDKHNQANGEDNRDGEGHNRGWNCGAEGPSDDDLVLLRRERLVRNLLATLLFSQGTPLLLGGDEIGRTQQGNNNAYCQDNALSWVDWTMTPERERLLAYTTRLLTLRRELPVLRRTRFFDGRPGADGVKDITWLLADGSEASEERWQDPRLNVIGALMWAGGLPEGDDDSRGEDGADPGQAPQARGDSVLLLINGSDGALAFALPGHGGGAWSLRLDTCRPGGVPRGDGQPISGRVTAPGHSLLLLTQPAIA